MKYNYDDNKQFMKDISSFFDNLDLSILSKEDVMKIDFIKNSWTEYYFDFVVPANLSKEQLLSKSMELFKISVDIENKLIRKQLYMFAYNYITSFASELEINALLDESEIKLLMKK